MRNHKKWIKEIHSPDTLICNCLSLAHQIIFMYDSEDNEIYAEIHFANYMGFLKRLWYGIKYIFGYKTCYGAWDSVIISQNNKHQFQKALDRIIDK